MWVAGFPKAVVDLIHGNECMTQEWIYLFLQPLCLSTLMGWGISGSNMTSWYYIDLVFLWLIYSFIDIKRWAQGHPLKYMTLFYVLSLLLCVPLFYFDSEVMKILPVPRLCEFFMGCCAALSFRQDYKIRGEVALSLLIVYLIFVVFTVIYPQTWKMKIETDQCALWKHDKDFQFHPSGLITVTSIVWAVVIHWLACTESGQEDSVLVHVLQFDFFKSLSNFSLHLYLSHAVTGAWLSNFLNVLGIKTWFSKEYHLIFVYVMSYALYAKVQPILDFYFNHKSAAPQAVTAV